MKRATSLLDKYIDLIVIDESERLNVIALEMMRDRYDCTNIALMLIGMPGIERKFSRFPQLYGRFGFVHEFRPWGKEELVFVLERWGANSARHSTPMISLTPGRRRDHVDHPRNFRLVDRLFTQMEGVMKINELIIIIDDVADAARSTLVIGIT